MRRTILIYLLIPPAIAVVLLGNLVSWWDRRRR